MGHSADHGHHHHDRSLPDFGPKRSVRRQLSRRLFVQEFGRRTMAVAILGTATVACASDTSDTSAAPAPTAAAPATSVPPTAVPATAVPATTVPSTAASEADDAAEAADGELIWEQVSFGFVSAYVLARGNELAVVDTGLAGNGAKIGEAIGMLGGNLDDLDHVILTHLHADHVGSLPELLDAAPGAVAYAGEADIAGIISPRAITAVNDGDDIFGLQVVGTPGHTAGHICLYDEAASLLIAGDALIESSGVVEGPSPQFTADMDAATASAQALAALQFENLAVGHGSPIRGGASDKVAAGVG